MKYATQRRPTPTAGEEAHVAGLVEPGRLALGEASEVGQNGRACAADVSFEYSSTEMGES